MYKCYMHIYIYIYIAMYLYIYAHVDICSFGRLPPIKFGDPPVDSYKTYYFKKF